MPQVLKSEGSLVGGAMIASFAGTWCNLHWSASGLNPETDGRGGAEGQGRVTFVEVVRAIGAM